MATTDYYALLEKKNFIAWLEAIVDKEPRYVHVVNEIITTLNTDKILKNNDGYIVLYENYRFKLMNTNTSKGVQVSLYSFINGSTRVIGVISDTRPFTVNRIPVPTPKPRPTPPVTNRLVYVPNSQLMSWYSGTNFNGTSHLNVSLNTFQSVDPLTVGSISIDNSGIPITSISNLANYTNLGGLEVANQLITSIDVSQTTDLEYLYVNNNELNTLNPQPLTNLVDIDCSNNNLTTLRLNNLNSLLTASCYNNNLTQLYITGSSNLTILNCANNQLTSLNATDLNHLESLVCNNNHLVTLNIHGAEEIITLNASNNALSLDSVNAILDDLDNYNNTNGSLNLSGGTNSGASGQGVAAKQSLISKGWTITTNPDLPRLAYTPNTQVLSYVANSNYYTDSTLVNFQDVDPDLVTRIDIFKSDNRITSLSNLETYENLTALTISDQSLTELYVTHSHKLVSLQCNSNAVLTTLSLSSSVTLVSLTCTGNSALTNLNLSHCHALQTLDCRYNNLSSLNISGSTILTNVTANNNTLTQTAVNSVLSYLDSYGMISGSVRLDGNFNSPPEGNGETNVTNLQNKGWIVLVNSPAILSTTAATSSDSTNIYGTGGNISHDGGYAITQRGVVYSKIHAIPVYGVDSSTSNGSGTGVFSSTLSGLTPSSLYYYRAYAINDIGTFYGSIRTRSTTA